jgi:transketolase/transaldolase
MNNILEHSTAALVVFDLPPHLAHDADATVAEARRLWTALARADAAIGIPATPAGIEALEQLVHAGVNTKLTLIFSAGQIRAARAAHRRGLARRLHDKLPVQGIASAVGIDLGRIDAAVDALLANSADATAVAVRGQAALAAARLACREWRHNNDTAFAVFAAFGATPQQLLWSGGAALAPEQPAADEEIEAARAVLAQLAHHGIDLETVGRQLQRAGLLQIEQEFTEPAALAA